MKLQLGAVLSVALLLTGCASPQPDNKQVATASADQPTPKKKCTASTGSRLGSCDGSTPEVTGSSGDAYRDSVIRNGIGVNPSPPH